MFFFARSTSVVTGSLHGLTAAPGQGAHMFPVTHAVAAFFQHEVPPLSRKYCYSPVTIISLTDLHCQNTSAIFRNGAGIFRANLIVIIYVFTNDEVYHGFRNGHLIETRF